MDYNSIFEEIKREINLDVKHGKVADYIPELAHVDPNKFGISLKCMDGQSFSMGDADEKFSAQSITKVFSLALAMNHFGQKVWSRMDVEPSGTSFNSLVLLEYEQGIPRNPFINSGALVIADMLVEKLEDPKGEFLEFVRNMTGSRDIDYNYKVANSERDHGFRNRAMANMLKSFGNIKGDVEDVLDFYFHQCSIEMSCKQLADAFMVFSNKGSMLGTKEKIITKQQSQRINALMLTCGFYDEAGEFAFRVGLPGKSGVGGGIAAVYPSEYSVAVWSPRLNKLGNSVLGMKTLELLTTKTGMGIF
ncbi:glutaminase A [Owenweeksia hongkongensis DSM 17368]|uniref:Glutaminase n=1 Tax=Owenweeksia hongkongensis (strain DSM 17368 / CIP 108786 / JCM 12287 / NRRL B-23963 / UST20020801) TaxID=926562 RepID=G8R1L3_OWEHD|nr:glutaminase [Owenweeksia hongkongensis]AEV31752.1 glutaminase A [Owenweeksia hongkongensis DSM 17368]